MCFKSQISLILNEKTNQGGVRIIMFTIDKSIIVPVLRTRQMKGRVKLGDMTSVRKMRIYDKVREIYAFCV